MALGRTHDKSDGNHDISSRGKYELVESTVSGPKSTACKLFWLLPMVGLLLAGVALMLAHHFFYAYLDGQIIDDEGSDLPPILRDQITSNIIGTTIAHGARIVLSMAVSRTFVQLFWQTLRSRRHTIQQIDALVDCEQSLLCLSTIRAATTAPLLFLLSAVASSMTLVVVLSPGALTVSSNLQRLEACVVPTVPNMTTSNFVAPSSLVDKVLVSGSYVPPSRAITCASGATSCSYNVSYVGPAFACIDNSKGSTFSSQSISHAEVGESLIWDTSLDQHYNLVFTTRDLVNNITQANICTGWEATYDVGVTVSGPSISVNVWDISLVSNRTTISTESPSSSLYFYMLDAMSGLEDTVFAGPNSSLRSERGSMLPNSRIFVVTASGNFTWSDNMTHVLVSYMQNISISLLSLELPYGTSDNGSPIGLLFVNTTCASNWDAYIYNPIRLLSTYSIALVLSSLAIASGCWLILRNGAEDRITALHIIHSALNPRLFHLPEGISPLTWIRLEREPIITGFITPKQIILPTENDRKDIDEDPRRGSLLVPNWMCHLRDLQILQNLNAQMISLLCFSLCCMVIHHLYNSFLEGKPPNSSTGGLNWITNQMIASDIGIALAYAGQTALIAPITMASCQLFWRSLRMQGHTIAQIDALMKAQTNVFSLSTFRCGPASLIVIIASLVQSFMPLLSVFAPNSIKITFDYQLSTECTVRAPRNLTSLKGSDVTGFQTPANEVFELESYFPPANPCSGTFGAQCSYGVDFIGPGFDCRDVTASSNFTAFQNSPPAAFSTGFSQSFFFGSSMWSSTVEGSNDNQELSIFVQTWDSPQAIYQAINCTCVSRRYSLLITHSSSSTVEVIDSSTLSPVFAYPDIQFLTYSAAVLNGTSISFMHGYFYASMAILGGRIVNGISESGVPEVLQELPNLLASSIGLGGSQNVTWSPNMLEALEGYVENMTLSILSGRIFSLGSPDGPELLEDFATTCDYTFTAYEYSPSRLFLSYGLAIFVTLICVLSGSNAIRKNGVDESVAFSRILRAVLNERMYNVRERLDMDSVIKADDDKEGSFAPFLKTKF